MQNRRSNKPEGRARRGKVALLAALVLAEIVLGGFVLAGELGRQAGLPRARGAEGPPRHSAGDALLAIGGVALLYACLRGRARLARAMGRGSVRLGQRDVGERERGMCRVGAPIEQAGRCPSTQTSAAGTWRHDVREQVNDGENAESAIIRPHAAALRNCRLDNGISGLRTGVDKKSDAAVDKLS